MKVLVSAMWVNPDATSEGICTAKFCNLLTSRGHEVVCLHADTSIEPGPYATMPDCQMLPLPREADRSPGPSPRRPIGGRIGRLAMQKSDAALAHATGFNRAEWHQRRRWRSGLEGAIAEHRPDVVFARGAGQDFRPHLAMTDLTDPPPWVANYHDPWPLSLYPDPYRQRSGSVSALQERANRRILRRADAVTFPSQRLLEWESRRARVDLATKGAVVAHLGPAEVPSPMERAHPGEPLVLLHAGNLNQIRHPQPLFDAVARLVDRHRRAGHDAPPPLRLVLLGAIDHRLLSSPEWKASVAPLEASGAVEVRSERISYEASLSALGAADVALVLAVGHPESPFFPAKLADLVALDGPLLVVAPTESTPADVMGTDHPGFVPLDDPAALDAALDRLVAADREGTLGSFRPPVAARELVAPDSVGAAIDDVLVRAIGRRER
jgi:hypothetical protein